MREWAVAFLFLWGLFLAGGVYSELNDQEKVQSSIQRGMDYLSIQPNLDAELVALFWGNQKSSLSSVSAVIDSKKEFLDSYHYPLKQFLAGNQMDESQIDPETLKSVYYQNFIGYFSCKPLNEEWLDQIDSVSEGPDFVEYDLAHSLLLFQLIRNDYFGGRCGNFPEWLEITEMKRKEKIQLVESTLSEKNNFDAWVERVAVLGFAGQPIADEDVEYIISNQLPSGGWKPVDYYSDEDATPHTTALAIWALMEASE